jgi:hypothetical protein
MVLTTELTIRYTTAYKASEPEELERLESSYKGDAGGHAFTVRTEVARRRRALRMRGAAI